MLPLRGSALPTPVHAPPAPREATLAPRAAPGPRPRFSVRSYAFLLVLAVALPLGALLVAALRQIADQEQDQALLSLRQVARIAAAEVDLVVADARGLLEQVAARPAVRQ